MTDYFAAGKCVWGIGNKDLGPISYIAERDAGFVSCDVSSVREVLQKMVTYPSLIQDYAKKAYDCGVKYHNGNEIIDKLMNEIVEY